MKKLVLFTILTFAFGSFAQDIKEVDLVIFSHMDGYGETTTISRDVFNSFKKAAAYYHLGKIKAIMKSSCFTDIYFIMTSEKKFYRISYDSNTKTALIRDPDKYVMTKERENVVWAGDINLITYIIRNPECRIPNDIPNYKNTLDTLE